MARVLLTGLPGSGKTTVVQRLVADYPGVAAGFMTREVRQGSRRVGFEIVTLEGRTAVLSHVDFAGPLRVGKYGVNLDNLHRLALPVMAPDPGIDLIVVDEIGKMECLSPRFIEAMERLWAAPVSVLATVAERGSGYIQAVKQKPGILLVRLNPQNREQMPVQLLSLLTTSRESKSD